MGDMGVTGFITVATAVVLIAIVVIAIRINNRVFTFLKKENDLIDSNPKHSKLFGRIQRQYLKAKQRTENDINLQSFIEEYVSDYKHNKSRMYVVQQIKFIQMLGSIAILIGVLGTFLGLVFSIGAIDEAQLESSILAMLDGIDVAFYTSIGGIVSSIFINFMVRIWNAEHLLMQIMLKIENKLFLAESKSVDLKLVESMQDVKTSIENMTTAFISIQNFSDGFKQATVNLNQFNDMFSTNTRTLSSLFGKMEDSTTAFNEKMETIVGQFQSLNGFLEKQGEIQAYSVNHMQQISSNLTNFMHEQTSIQKYNLDAIATISHTFDQAKQDIQGYMEESKNGLHHTFEAMRSFYDQTLEKQGQLIGSQERLEQRNTLLMDQVHEATTAMREVLETNSFEHIADLTHQFNRSIQEMNNQFQSFIHYFQHTDNVQQEYKRFYENIVAYINEQGMKQESNQTAMMEYASSLADQNHEMVALFTKTQDYHAAYDANSRRLTDEMNNVITHSEQIFAETDARMKEQLSTLHHTMNQFVTLSNEKMSELILKLDGSLGENLQKSLRSFEHYVEMTNTIIDKKFKAIVESNTISKEVEAFSMQSLQQSIDTLNDHIQKLAQENVYAK